MPFTLPLIGHLSHAWFHLIKLGRLQRENGLERPATHILFQEPLLTLIRCQDNWRDSPITSFLFKRHILLIFRSDFIWVWAFNVPWFAGWHAERWDFSTDPPEGFYSATSPALPPGSQGLSVPTEHRKSSNKMPNHPYLISGTLTFSSSYLMGGFICQTNVKNTIPQARSLWQRRQLFLVCLADTSHPLGEGRELPAAWYIRRQGCAAGFIWIICHLNPAKNGKRFKLGHNFISKPQEPSSPCIVC